MRAILRGLGSLKLTVWILTLLIMVFFAGALVMPLYPGAHAGMNAMPLFQWWLQKGRGAMLMNGWLPLSVLLLGVLTLNTLVCTARSLRPGPSLWAHTTHAGFLLILAAHLVSASTGFREGGIVLARGRAVEVPRLNVQLILKGIDYVPYPGGMPKDYGADILLVTPDGPLEEHLGPNRPAFYKGIPIYLKDFGFQPVQYAVCEIAHDPGAPVALAGSLLFLIGSVPLPMLARRGRAGDGMKEDS